MTDAPLTYTNRTTHDLVVGSITRYDNGTAAVTPTDGVSAQAPADVAPQLTEGSAYTLETQGTLITGWQIGGNWITRMSDDDILALRAGWNAAIQAQQQADLDANSTAWQAREDALPDWIKPRLAYFHQSGGDDFRLTGWEYELTVAELAVAYFNDGRVWNGPATSAYLDKQAVTGNQRSFAQSMADVHHDGTPLDGTLSAMHPITGQRQYGNPQ